MQIKNSSHRYGFVAILLHWVVALTVSAMFALGLWMTSLTYYHSWYNQGPLLHKGIGVLLFLLLLFRLLWRVISIQPESSNKKRSFEYIAGYLAHGLLYLLLFLVTISGYFISTAEGSSLPLFNLFEIPALLHGYEDQEDIAGDLHILFVYSTISLASLHALAALKHHFIDRDRTLLRMLGR